MNATEQPSGRLVDINNTLGEEEVTVSKASNGRKGLKHSIDTLRRISRSQSGKVHSEETRQKMSQARLGWKPTLETRAKMAEAKLGRTLEPETKDKIGRKVSETKQMLRKKHLSPALDAEIPLQNSFLSAENLTQEIAREKAVVEMQELRRELAKWMQEYEALHGVKTTIEQVSTSNPDMYRKFVRFVALRELIRQSDV